MPYCVKCDIDLGPYEQVCPLCGTPAYSSKAESQPISSDPYPVAQQPQDSTKMGRVSMLTLLSMPFLLAIAIFNICDLATHGMLKWTGVVVSCIILIYIISVIPAVLRPALPLQLLIDLVAVQLVLFYICHFLRGIWFWPLAFPITLYPFACAIFLILLRYFSGLDALKIASLSTLLAGIYCMFIEWRINLFFSVRQGFVWAQYPLIALLLLSAVLFFASRDEVLKARLARRFFI